MKQDPTTPGSLTRLEQLDFAALARLVKTKFRVSATVGDALELELYEVTPARTVPAGKDTRKVYESFSLLFRGPADRLLPQQIYSFESASVGRSELFIVPIGRDQEGIRYEAAFNRLIEVR